MGTWQTQAKGLCTPKTGYHTASSLSSDFRGINAQIPLYGLKIAI